MVCEMRDCCNLLWRLSFQAFAIKEFYPTKEAKGARLGYNLISNHAFVDGNKRIGMYVMLTFLQRATASIWIITMMMFQTLV